jgi:hypothetical protein
MYKIAAMKSGRTIKSYDRLYADNDRKINSVCATIRRNWKARDPFVKVMIKRA